MLGRENLDLKVQEAGAQLALAAVGSIAIVRAGGRPAERAMDLAAGFGATLAAMVSRAIAYNIERYRRAQRVGVFRVRSWP